MFHHEVTEDVISGQKTKRDQIGEDNEVSGANTQKSGIENDVSGVNIHKLGIENLGLEEI